jgi:UPF0755 protein
MSIEQKSNVMTFPKIGKFIIIFFALAFIVVGIRAWQLYQYVFQENIKSNYILYIPKDATFNQVSDSLHINDILISEKAFNWVSKKKNYKTAVKPGRYLLQKGMNTNQIVNVLRSGIQEPVNVTFNNIRFKENLAGQVSKYIWTDSLSILNLFSNKELIEGFGFNTENFRVMFIPNTYQFYWTTSAEEFAQRMKKEYDKFWTKERKAKAKQVELSPEEIIILASIVQSETVKSDELKRVAGLYINRLKRGILLQADPTVKYAIGDYSIKRILNKHLETDSPYNTYKYAGLPPGPIMFPDITVIDAVLNYEKNRYLYMCAKEDFSGYHNFAKTLAQHNRNAAKYRAALDKNRIWK